MNLLNYSGDIMNNKTKHTEHDYGAEFSEELFGYAKNMGCKTKEEFAMFFRARESILRL